MRSQKKTVPKIGRHPRAEGTGDEQTDSDIFPYRRPIHHKVVTGRGNSFRRREPFPKRSPTFHAHIHLGVTFHYAFNSFVSLSPRLFDKFARKKNSEEHRDD